MATPTADKLKIYFPSKNLTADGQTLPILTVDSGTVSTIVDAALTQADGYWEGAIGWFLGNTTTVALRGQFFHVRSFDAAGDTLTLSRELPAVPQAGDTYRIALGGNWRSSHETFGMLVGGQLPELATVSGVNITGLTITKASALLGEGTLSVEYTYASQILRIKMGTQDLGVGLDVSSDVSGGVIFAADGQAFIRVNVTVASLPTADATDTWTLTYPERTFSPDFEAYETAEGSGGRTRYRLECLKNDDSVDGMVDLTAYVDRPSGTASTIATGSSLGLVAGSFDVTDASDWPTRSFWVRNSTANGSAGDCRYVKYRSGNTLYCYGIDWAVLGFDQGTSALQQGDAVSGFSSGATAVVDQVLVTSGSWGGSDAAGILLLKMVTGNFMDNEKIVIGATQMAMSDGASYAGLRGHQATTWSAADVVSVMADVDIAVALPSSGQFEDPSGETIAPDDVEFAYAEDTASAIPLGNLAPGAITGVWRREWIMDGHQSRAGIIGDTIYSWS